jgi:hypothetical protein
MGKPRDLANVVATGNILADGAVAPAELTGVNATAAELNILDGVTATASELNLLDGVTATTAELNHVDGVTSNVQTQMDTKAPVASPTFTGTVTGPTINASTALQIGGVAVTATAAELNKMDGVTVSASDINSVTTKAASLSDLSVTASASELNTLDGITATTAELNYNDVTTLGTVEASKVVTADANGDVLFPDNEKLKLGTGGDLQIFHNGSASFIQDGGTGNLVLQAADSVIMQNAAGDENLFVASQNGAVSLYHDNSIKLATSATGVDVTGTAVTDGVTVDGTLDIEEVYEKVTVQTSTTGTITFDTTAQAVELYTADQTANRTINFSNVNANLAVGQSVTVAIAMTQGSTAYYLNAYQVDGSSVTPKWSGGSAPTAGNASSIDAYSFTIIKTADATFTVLASQTQFA